jgi:hypothetical protein
MQQQKMYGRRVRSYGAGEVVVIWFNTNGLQKWGGAVSDPTTARVCACHHRFGRDNTSTR